MSKNTEVAPLQLHNMQQVTEFSKQLGTFIANSKLTEQIQKKNYVLVEGWKFAGVNFGLTPIVDSVEDLSEGMIYIFFEEKQGSRGKYEKVYFATRDESVAKSYMPEKFKRSSRVTKIPFYKYRCRVSIINQSNQNKVGSGEAICTNAEMGKIHFDEYAINSMCQTRAIGKALRNVIGFIMQAAGFEATPAEEMSENYVYDNPEKGTVNSYLFDEIAKFKSERELIEWAMSQDQDILDDETFQQAVNAKTKKLRDVKN